METLKSNELEGKLQASEFVIIDFSSPGCAPCKKIPPLIAEVLTQLEGVDISAFEVNVADEPEAGQKNFILGVPTIIIFKNGQEISRFNSVPKIEKIVRAIKP
ncbi:MAG: thioredoxin family protein [Candidatus Aminicenantes bacterium]|nr:thioredoxin family protein [Candidatus Aminicenantes bacterium]